MKKSGRNDTELFLSNISYTRFCIHFVFFSSPLVTSFRAAGSHICITWRRTEKKKCDRRCQEKTLTVMEEGRLVSTAPSARPSVNLSLT